jgi:hypothetical protein
MKITDWEIEIEKIDWLIVHTVILVDEDSSVKTIKRIHFHLIDTSILEAV